MRAINAGPSYSRKAGGPCADAVATDIGANVMPDTTEAAALRLRAFIQAVERKAGAYMGPGQVGEFRARPRKDPLSTTYEECLGKLTVEERGELDRMIQKMSSVLGSPPGAVTPP